MTDWQIRDSLSLSLSISKPRTNPNPTQNQLRTASLAEPKPTANAWRILGGSERERGSGSGRDYLICCVMSIARNGNERTFPGKACHTHMLALSPSLPLTFSPALCQPQSITSKRILIFIKIIKTCAKTQSENVVRYLYTL